MNEAQKQREWVERARAATGARQVTLHRLPKWARQAIRASLKRDGREHELREFYDIATWLMNHALTDSGHLFDHWGTSRIHRYGYEGPSLVTEPYASRSTIEEALRFADWLGCEVEIGMASWWYPNNTTRIEFFPRSP